jgi:hypothetical protein
MSPILLLSLLAAVEPGASKALEAGTYRLDVNVVVLASVPVLGEQRTVTSTTSIIELDANGMATATACKVVTEGPGFTSRLPPASLRALPTSRFAIVTDGTTIRADMGAGRLAYTGDGPMPQSADDPRVTDPDRDGKPGLRMLLNLGPLGQWTIQIVSRGHTKLEGQMTADGAVGRLTSVISEEQVLSGLPVSLPSRGEPIDPGRSSFVLRRLAKPSDRSFCAW